jgi:DNA-binding transcriptional LysR family regulator
VGGDLRVVIANQGDTDGAVFHGSSLRLLIDGTHYRLAFTHSTLAFAQVINAATHYQLDYPDLALILALVRGGSLARASQLLKVDVSTVFRAVRRLEAALGQQLFEKSRAGYLPTNLAQTLAEQAERAEQALEAARIGVEQGGEVVSGTVRLTCTDSVLQGLLLPALAQFMPNYPALTIELSTSNDFANLSRRDADIALRLTRTPPEHLVGRQLAKISYRVCASSRYLQNVDASDLTALTWIAPDDFLPDHPTVAWRRQHLPGVTPGYRCNSMLSVTELVRAGLGVAALPDFLITEGVQALSEPLHGYDTALWLLTRPDCRALRSVVTLFDELGRVLRLP